MEVEKYTGNVSAMRRSPFLAAEDIDGLGDVEVIIEAAMRIKDAVMQDGRKMEEGFAIKFKGKDKMMVLNSTNMKTLSRAYGASTTGWVDKAVKIYIQDGVRKPGGTKGETTRGLRIKVDSKIVQQKASDAAQASMLNKVKG